jgi:hypothetical protein
MSTGLETLTGVLILTQEGREAIKSPPATMTARSRNILVQVDGKRSVDDIRQMFRGLDGLEQSLHALLSGKYVQVSRGCKEAVSYLLKETLGLKSPTLVRKLDELHAKYGESCWEHLDEIEKTARLFYGEVIADALKSDIAKIVREYRQ